MKTERPPVFKSWRTWYGLLIANLILLIIVFYVTMKIFN
jgi:hypothetical protein